MSLAIQIIFILGLMYGAFGLKGVYTFTFIWLTEISLLSCSILGIVLDFAFGFHDKASVEALVGTTLNGVTEGWQGYPIGVVFLGVMTDIYFAFHKLMFKALFSFTPFSTIFLVIFVVGTVRMFKRLFGDDIAGWSGNSVKLDDFELNQARWSRESSAAKKARRREIERRGGVQI